MNYEGIISRIPVIDGKRFKFCLFVPETNEEISCLSEIALARSGRVHAISVSSLHVSKNRPLVCCNMQRDAAAR